MALIDAAATRAKTAPDAVLDECSWLGAAIDEDRGAQRFSVWAQSTVIDENTGSPVIEAPLFSALHRRAGLEAAWPVGNAGLLHVYGYLLSTEPTPYGLKRERYLDSGLARAYGLTDDEFVPWARGRALLARVTDAASALLRTAAVRTSDSTALALGRATDGGPWALAYARDDRLVTTFPIAAPQLVLEDWDADPQRLRWNAVA